MLTIGETIGESGGSQSLNVSGNGELILSGTDNYTGGTTVSGGTLDFTAGSAITGGGLVTISGSGCLAFGSDSGSGAGSGAGSDLGSGALLAASSPVGAEAAGPGTPVPEPGTLALLLAAGLGGVAVWLRRARKLVGCVKRTAGKMVGYARSLNLRNGSRWFRPVRVTHHRPGLPCSTHPTVNNPG